ncbi:MAG: hypothetical protein JOZ02_24005 [Acidobacteria bacterium]|nr:hypothetical protein [Acidobacteriota bacterium]
MRLSVILLLLLTAPAPRADAAAAKKAEADRAWPSFYAAFRGAVRRRDREALRRMMPAEFDYSDDGGDDDGDGDSRDEAFGRWDESRGRGWKVFERLLRGGAVPGEGRLGSHNGTPQRVAPPAINKRVNVVSGRIAWYAVFEFREDRRWYCTVFKECCD